MTVNVPRSSGNANSRCDTLHSLAPERIDTTDRSRSLDDDFLSPSIAIIDNERRVTSADYGSVPDTCRSDFICYPISIGLNDDYMPNSFRVIIL